MIKKHNIINVKNIVLFIISILLVLFTFYQMRIIVIAINNDTEITESVAIAETSAGNFSNEITSETGNIAEINNNIENTDNSENIAGNIVESDNSSKNTIENNSNIVLDNKVENDNANIIENSINDTSKTEIENVINDEENDSNNNDIIEEIPTELVYDNGEYKVTISAIKENALRDVKEVRVTPITSETSEAEYNEISEKLQNKVDEKNQLNPKTEKIELAGFLAYDITLISNDGTKIEPNGDVNVSIEYIVVPAKASEFVNSDVSVIHFEENSLNENVSLQEYSLDNQNLNIETDSDNQIKKVEFETSSFSTFSIIWSNTIIVEDNPVVEEYMNLTVHYVDTQGNEIGNNTIQNVNVSSGDTITLSDYANSNNIQDYLYRSAHYNNLGGSIITKIVFVLENGTYSAIFYNENSIVANLHYSNETRKMDIYLVYTKVNSLGITDTIADNGNLNVVITDSNGVDISDNYTYKWYKSDSENGEYTEVTRMKITGLTYNITENGKSLNVALDSGSNKWYYVKAIEGNGNEYVSGKYNVPYYEELRNGDFEYPNIAETSGAVNTWASQNNQGDYTNTNGMIRHYRNSDILSSVIWKTTSADGWIELARNGETDNNILAAYNIKLVEDGAVSGEQFAELNCQLPGALYQDILTIPSQQLSWRLSHRGRADYSEEVGVEADTMYLVIMSTKDAEMYDVTTQEKVQAIIDGTINCPGALVRQITDNSDAWGHYSGDYTVPDGQYLTRVFFVAGETASGNKSDGNFLDNVAVGQSISPSIPGQTTVNVRKEIKGIGNDADLENYVLNITENNNSISKGYFNFVWDPEKNVWYSQQTYQITTDKTYGKANAKFSELESQIIMDNYNFVSAKYQIDSGEMKDLTLDNGSYYTENFELVENRTYNLVITNTYSTATIKINKKNIFEDLLIGASFTIKEENNLSNTQTITDRDDGIITFENIKYNTNYIITEDSAPDKYYAMTSELKVKVNKDNTITILNPTDTEIAKLVSISNNNELNIINIKHTELPEAGGIGNYGFYIIGTIMMISPIIIFKKKLKKERK